MRLRRSMVMDLNGKHRPRGGSGPRRVKGFLSYLLVGLCLTGCAPLFLFGAGTAVGIAGYKYYHGSLEVVFMAPFIDTWDASLKALKDMEIEITGAEHDMTSGSITGRKADNTPGRISLKYRTSRETEALIRVGPLGDRAASEAVKEKIRRVLFGA
jgi:hypothetical protein